MCPPPEAPRDMENIGLQDIQLEWWRYFLLAMTYSFCFLCIIKNPVYSRALLFIKLIAYEHRWWYLGPSIVILFSYNVIIMLMPVWPVPGPVTPVAAALCETITWSSHQQKDGSQLDNLQRSQLVTQPFPRTQDFSLGLNTALTSTARDAPCTALHCAVRTGCCNMSLICVMDCTPTTLCIVCFLLQILILFVPHLRNLFQRGLVQDPTVGQWSTGQQNTESHFHFASGNQPSCASHWGRRGYQLLAPKFVNVTECAIMWLNVWDEICTRV